MRQKLSTLMTAILWITALAVYAQAPEGFNYQAVIRDGSGEILANQLLTMRFTIRTGSATGTIQYQETKALTTDDFGLVDHAVGTGTVASGTFSGITWSSGAKYLMVEVNTGTGYVNLGTQKLMSVPYTLEAEHATNAENATNAIIATNATKAVKLDGGGLNIDGSADDKIEFIAAGIGEGKAFLLANCWGTSNQFDWLRFTRGSTTKFQVTQQGNVYAAGKVGIGTASPARKLEVEGTASGQDALLLLRNQVGYRPTILFSENTGVQMGIEYDGTGAGGSNRMHILGIDQSPITTFYANGNVTISGSLSKGGGSFKIDHPVDPANKLLYHSFVESPDMMNVYNGNVILDAGGQAVVNLPDYFEALNKDFRYQLTCIGGFAPVYVAEKVNSNQFTIAGGNPGMEVSWQVTGIRQDAWANKNRIPNEVDKTGDDIGRYLHPEAFDLPSDMRMPSLSGGSSISEEIDTK